MVIPGATVTKITGLPGRGSSGGTGTVNGNGGGTTSGGTRFGLTIGPEDALGFSATGGVGGGVGSSSPSVVA